MPLCGGSKTVQRKLVLLYVRRDLSISGISLSVNNNDTTDFTGATEAMVLAGKRLYSMFSPEGE